MEVGNFDECEQRCHDGQDDAVYELGSLRTEKFQVRLLAALIDWDSETEVGTFLEMGA